MIRRRFMITHSIEYRKLYDYSHKVYSKNDLPGILYNRLTNIEQRLWYNNGKQHRDNDLPYYINLINKYDNLLYAFYKYGITYRYVGYSKRFNKYGNEYKFIKGICFELLKEELYK